MKPEEISASFRAFIATADFIELSTDERCGLLGGIPISMYRHWAAEGAPALSDDHLNRIGHLLGIVKMLRTIFARDADGLRWLRGANSDKPFSGQSPLQLMLRGSADDLYAVRQYLDAWANT